LIRAGIGYASRGDSLSLSLQSDASIPCNSFPLSTYEKKKRLYAWLYAPKIEPYCLGCQDLPCWHGSVSRGFAKGFADLEIMSLGSRQSGLHEGDIGRSSLDHVILAKEFQVQVLVWRNPRRPSMAHYVGAHGRPSEFLLLCDRVF